MEYQLLSNRIVTGESETRSTVFDDLPSLATGYNGTANDDTEHKSNVQIAREGRLSWRKQTRLRLRKSINRMYEHGLVTSKPFEGAS